MSDASGAPGSLICVTGAPGSHVDLVGSVITLLGAEVHGHPGSSALARLADAVLGDLGGSWLDPPPLPKTWRGPEVDASLVSRARNTLRAVQAGTERGGWTDPRAALLMGFFRAHGAVEPVVLALGRQVDAGKPIEELAVPDARGAALSIRYVHALLQQVEAPVVVELDRLLADPVATALQLAQSLHLPDPSEAVLASVAGVIRSFDGDPTDEAPDRLAPCREVHALLAAGAMAEARRCVERADRTSGGDLGAAFRATAASSVDPEVRQLRRQLAAAETELARQRVVTQDMQRRYRAAQVALQDLRTERAVQVVLALAPLVRRARARLGAIRRRGRLLGGHLLRLLRAPAARHAGASPTQSGRPAPDAAIRSEDFGEAPTSGPLVSIVILNRDGLHHLQRCLPAVLASAYRCFEVIVVDNASSDGSVEHLRKIDADVRFVVIENDENASFSAANNQALAAARGDLVLLLNNDIEPIRSDWLGHMVQSIEDPGVGAVGARLVYPVRPGRSEIGGPADLTLQHGGLDFVTNRFPPFAWHVHKGSDPTNAFARRVADVPAVTGACMLLRRTDLERVGALCEQYHYGLEDVDLCLTLRAHGFRLRYDGRASLFHHEFGTQAVAGTDRREHRRSNRDVFIARWGPHVFREVLGDKLVSGGAWSTEPLQVRVLADLWRPGHGALGPLQRLVPDHVDLDVVRGSVVGRRPADVSLSLRPVRPAHDTGGVHVALVERAERWTSEALDGHDLVLAPDEEVRRLLQPMTLHDPAVVGEPELGKVLAAVEGWVAALRIAICTEAPAGSPGFDWAREVQEACHRLGHPARLFPQGEWDAAERAVCDVVLHLHRDEVLLTYPAQANILWSERQLDEPPMLPAAEYDLVVTRRPLTAIEKVVDGTPHLLAGPGAANGPELTTDAEVAAVLARLAGPLLEPRLVTTGPGAPRA